jgi:hypothetical protein
MWKELSQRLSGIRNARLKNSSTVIVPLTSSSGLHSDHCADSDSNSDHCADSDSNSDHCADSDSKSDHCADSQNTSAN